MYDDHSRNPARPLHNFLCLLVKRFQLRVNPRKSVAKKLQLIRLRIIWIRIVVKPLARLAAVPSGHHQSLQEWRRGEAALFEFVEHYMGDVISRVQADEIEQRERAHG